METPRTLGGFALKERLGAGAMGTVYKAVQTSLGRDVVIKTLHPHLAEDADLIARFEREARHAANLRHHNTVAVIEFGRDAAIHYIAMEYVEGLDLKEILQIRREILHHQDGFPTAIALLVLRDICRGLEEAHSKDIVHRDIKPANLMITTGGEVKVMDFGLARETAESSTLTAAGSIMGSAAYMSPEQAKGEHLDHRSDVFSTGLVGYELLTGQRAFPGESYAAVIQAVIHGDVEPLGKVMPQLPGEVVELIHAMVAKDRNFRCPSMTVARDLLEPLVDKMVERREDALLGEFVREARNAKKSLEPSPISTQVATAETRAESPAAGAMETVAAAPSAPSPTATPPSSPVASPAGTSQGTAASESESASGLDATVAADPTPPPVRPAPEIAETKKRSPIVLILSIVIALGVLGFGAWKVLGPTAGNPDPTELAESEDPTENRSGDDALGDDPIDTASSGSGNTPIEDDSDDSNDGDRQGNDDSGTTQHETGDPETNEDSTGSRGQETTQNDATSDLQDQISHPEENVPDQTEVEPPEPFSKRYSISTRPYAEVYIDDDTKNWTPTSNRFEVTLSSGEHRFRLVNSGLGIDTTLRYTVSSRDPNNIIILDAENGAVRARVN